MAERGYGDWLPRAAMTLAMALCALVAMRGCSAGPIASSKPAPEHATRQPPPPPVSAPPTTMTDAAGPSSKQASTQAPTQAPTQVPTQAPHSPLAEGPAAPAGAPEGEEKLAAPAPSPVLSLMDVPSPVSYASAGESLQRVLSLSENYSLLGLQSITLAPQGLPGFGDAAIDGPRTDLDGVASKSQTDLKLRKGEADSGGSPPAGPGGPRPGEPTGGSRGGGGGAREELYDVAKPSPLRKGDGAEKGVDRAAGGAKPAAPAGRAVGRPAEGVTREQRRDKLEVPLRVGKDEAAVKEAVQAGLEPELALHPQPRFDEELWVIQRTARPERAGSAGPESPRSGALMLREGARGAERAAVLRGTAVRAAIAGPVSRVTLTQRFENPAAAAVEAVYVLPLPRDAAITDFVMTVGSRRIRGVIRERAEAERIFLDAQRQGKIVSLLGEETPNLFVQRLGNLASGAALDVSVTYFSTLEYREGAYEFVLPLGASPHYQGAASVTPEVRDGRGVSVEVQVDAGVPLRGLECATHTVDVSPVSASEATVVLRASDTLPNRDLVLRIAVSGGEGPSVGVLPQTDASGTYFTMVIVPPGPDGAAGRRGPVELILVPDLSSAATPAQAAMMRAAAARLAGRLTPQDRLLIVAGPGEPGVPMAATPEVIAASLGTLASEGPRPGLAPLLRAALSLPAPGGERVVCVLSRGEPEGAVELLRDARARLGSGRLFAFSIDEPVAGFTLESLARVGRGGVIHLAASGAIEPPLDAFMDTVSRPVLTDLAIDWGGAVVEDVFPRRLPDLCAGRPVHVVGRLVSPPTDGQRIRVFGTARGPSGVRREEFALPWREASTVPGAIHTLWARAKVLSMSETLGRDAAKDAELRREIVAMALSHNLVSPFTSFIAVDALSSVPPPDAPSTPAAPLQAANREVGVPGR